MGSEPSKIGITPSRIVLCLILPAVFIMILKRLIPTPLNALLFLGVWLLGIYLARRERRMAESHQRSN